MPVLNEDGAAADGSYSRQRCSCLPFCFWGAGRRPNKSGGAQAKRRRRRRLRLSSWLAWPWFRKSGGNGDAAGEGGGRDGSSDKQGKRRRRRLLVLLTTSLQPKKALASVVSGDSSALLPLPVPVPAKVSSYGDAKKQSNRRQPRRRATADDGDVASGSRQPQASATAATDASTGSATAPAHARSLPETTTTTTSQAPSPRPSDGPAASGRRTWRAPSRRHSLRRPGDGDCSSSCGLWTAATTLGVVVLFGRVTAVVFLCSCLYGARFVRAWAAGVGGGAGASAKAQLRSDGVSSSGRRFGDAVEVAAGDKVVVAEMCATDQECKKKVAMAGLLGRAGKAPSSRFGR